MPPDRYRIAAALPPDGGWRCELALDREAVPPRPVALARVPPAVSADASALAALARGVDLAARLTHPAVLPVHGLAEVGGGLAVVSLFREGETLRAVLDGGGPLSPALAARVVGDVARAVQAAHGLAAAGARPLAHGALRPEVVLVAEDGAVLLTGLGRPVDPPAIPADDLRALRRLLSECLAPGGVGPLPPELAALAADPPPAGGGAVPTAGEFADALAAAVQAATPGALVARVDSAIPKGATARASRRRALAQVLLAEAGGDPAAPAGPAALRPALSPPPFRSPLAAPEGGAGPGRATPPPRSLGASPPPARSRPPEGPPSPAPPPAPAAGRTPTLVAPPPPPVPAALPRRAPPSLGQREGQPQARGGLLDDDRTPVRVAGALALLGLVIGFLLGR